MISKKKWTEQFVFKPAWWLRNPHLQTIWPTFCRAPIQSLPLIYERLELPDGDFIDLNWLEGGNKPIVIVLHGLEGSILSPYAKGMMAAIYHTAGARCVFMHFRGCSGEPNRLQRGYHSGETTDLAYVVQEIRRRYPRIILGAVGFSLGANVLLKWLGETGQDNPLSAAVGISVPFELLNSALRLQLGLSQFYQSYFLKCLRKRLTHKFALYPPEIQFPPLETLKTLEEFDDQVTAPLHGFASGIDYYQRSSCRQFLKNIHCPTLIIHSRDDPFISETAIPSTSEVAASVHLEITHAGGHVGFIAGDKLGRAEYWLETRVPQFFKTHLF